MPNFVVRNENFRDEVLKHSYPFDEQSLLEDDEVFIGTDLIVDAVFYLKEPAELPLSIGVVDGTSGALDQALFIIVDAGGVEVGRVAAGYDTEEATVIGPRGVTVGCVVFSSEGLSRFLGRVAGKVFTLLTDVATFSLDVCHVVRAPHLRYLAVNDQAVHGDVTIVARHGCKFVAEGTSIRLDVFGDPPSTDPDRIPVRSINGVANRSIWLQGHPRANLRITNEDGGIRFAQAEDLTT